MKVENWYGGLYNVCKEVYGEAIFNDVPKATDKSPYIRNIVRSGKAYIILDILDNYYTGSFKDKVKNKIKEIKEEPLSDYCVYRIKDEDNNIIYVGKSIDLRRRLTQHLNITEHLFRERYKKEKLKELHTIEYIECANILYMHVYEQYFITKYTPKYNIEHKNMNIPLEDFGVTSEVVWKLYDLQTLGDWYTYFKSWQNS